MRVLHLLISIGLFGLLYGCGSNEDNNSTTQQPNPIDGTPVFTQTQDKTVNVNDVQPFEFDLSASDPKQLTLSYTVNGVGFNPVDVGASVDVATGRFSWDISAIATGAYEFTFSATNTNSEAASMNVVIYVQDTNYNAGSDLYTSSGCGLGGCHNATGNSGNLPSLIQCLTASTLTTAIASVTSMNSLSLTDQNKADIATYLNNAVPGAC